MAAPDSRVRQLLAVRSSSHTREFRYNSDVSRRFRVTGCCWYAHHLPVRMGKNTRRQWADAEASKRPEKNASLKRRRSKKGQSGALVQMLHDSFPRRQKVHEFTENGEERFADFSDIVATDWQQRIPDSEDESLYESRKLIMRQLVMNQLNYMREHQQQHVEDRHVEAEPKPSDTDSWLEIEQSFAEIYQPLPFDVGMDSWRSMSKEQMLETVTSRRLRAELKYLSRAEILSQIQTIRARQTKKKSSPVYEDMSATTSVEHKPKKKKEKKVKLVSPEHDKKKAFENHTYQNTAAYRGQSLADIYQAKVEARKRELRLEKEAEQRARALYVTRAQIHAEEGDGVSNASSGRQQGFISRASILSKWGTATTTPVETTKTKKELIEQFWRQRDYVSAEDVRSLNGQVKSDGVYKNPEAFSSDDSCPSNCEECCDDDDCSQCSCSSCASVGTVLPVAAEKRAQYADTENIETKKQGEALETEIVKLEIKHVEANRIDIEKVEENEEDEEKAPEPVPLSLVKQRKMEFERLRVIEEQENRLKELVRQQKKAPNPPQSQSWLDIAKKARQLEDKWHKARRTASSVVNPAQAIYEPVPASQVLQKEDAKKKSSKSNKKSRTNRKRTKVLQQLRSRMRENLAADLDPGVRERRHQELQELLSDALHAGTQTLSNINLGLIYVPMEEQLEKEAQEKADDAASSKSSRGSRVTLIEPLPDNATARNGEDNEDVFGSIDTLIFEPKAGVSATLKTEEIDEMEKKIAREFEYLNDSQYGSCPEDSLTRSRTLSSGSGGSTSSTGSKNGLRAAAASVTAMPPRQQFPSDTEDRTGFCAAAAYCDASASNSSSTLSSSSISLTSFESVIRHGEKSIIPTPPPLPDAPLVPAPASESSDEVHTPRHIEIKSARSSQLDNSEAYTNVETDASWDYYPECGTDELAIGNLRKRPCPQYESEADETARLLESLRVAEETNASTSIRLIFPLDKQSVKDSFTVLAETVRSVQSPDSGFRSLPEAVPEAPVESSGPRKRDTMIKELKSRLMDKFQCVGDGHDSSAPPSLRRHPEQPKKKTKVASKLESLLSTFNALAEMKADGRVYRVPREPLINDDIDYDSIAFQSTGFPQHLHIYQRLQHPDGYSEPASTIYNPSLPDEFIPVYNPIDPACFEGNQFIDFDSRYPFDESLPEALHPEHSDPLDERSSSEEDERTRKQRRRRKKRTRPAPTWSDVENQIFAGDNEEALLLDDPALNPYHHRHHHPSRIGQYQDDDWLFWDQMYSWCQSEADRERWESERTHRMLLWMQRVQQNCEASGLPMPACWQAKQRASVQWLLSKAYSHQVPDELGEPFYRDAHDQDYLKPSIVHSLANADLYCRALAYIYADPNYCQLNHWGVIQVLSRKGVYVAEPSDVALTETTLIHTSPLRMSAHMAVMEGLMGLFVKEVVSAERVVSAIRRFADLEPGQSSPKESEQALLLWISKACQALKKRLAAEADGHGESVPNFPELRELADLSDGLSLMGLVVFYCPDYVDWTRLATNEPFSMADCLFNLEMMQKFCAETLPYNVFHMGLEDVVYMHSSVRQNMLAFLADLFYVLEVRPAKCVRPPSLLRDRYPISEESSSAASTGPIVSNDSVASPRKSFHRRTSLQPVVRSIPDLRSSGGKSAIRRQGSLQDRKRQTVHEAITSSPSSSTVTSSPRRRFEPETETRSPAGEESSFVVQRGKTVPTLFNVAEGATARGSRVAAIKERFNTDTKAEERGEERSFNASGPAGVPSNWEERKNTSYSGRRSRRNSISDDSHLTIENFGGSQDNLSMFGRNPDKEPVTLQHTGRRPSIDSAASPDYPVAGTPSTFSGSNFWRRTNNERTRSQENLSDYVMDNRDIEEQLERRSRTSSPTFSSVSSATKSGSNKQFVIIQANAPPSGPSEAADLYEETRATLSRATNFAELSKLRESFGNNSAINIVYMQNDKDASSKSGSPAGRRAADPRKASSSITEATSWDPQAPSVDVGSDDVSSAADLYGIRLQMEEKRKRIEAEKRQAEVLANRQREKVGKAAFLQAVKGGGKGSPLENASPTMDSYTPTSLDSPSRPAPAQMASTPEYERPEYDFHHPPQQQQQQHMSPAHHPLQYDPYRPMNGTGDPSGGGQFYLHEQAPSPRRTWGQPQPISPAGPANHMAGYRPDDYGMQQQQRRAQWGAPQPVQTMMGHHGYMMPQNNYMDPRGPGGYLPGPPRGHPMDGPYGQGYYPNGAPFPEQADPYYYSPARQHPMQPMPPMYPGYSEQGQRSGYSTPPSQHPPQPSYPSSADQRAPFRLHPNDGPTDASPRPVEPSFQRISEPPAPRSPAPSVKSNHSDEQRATPSRPDPKTTPSTGRPVPATRTMTPQTKTHSTNGVNNTASSPTIHSAVPVPSIDDMAPQNVSFIETPSTDEPDLEKLPRRLRNLNITSGSRTYRIPHESQSSPPRPTISRSFKASPSPTRTPASPPTHRRRPSPSPSPSPSPTESPDETVVDEGVKTEQLKENVEPDRGFYITFGDVSGPKRPKPQLGANRQPSPKKTSVSTPAPVVEPTISSTSASSYGSAKFNSREESPRRSLSSMTREYSPFESRDSGFGNHEEMRLFQAATATPGTLSAGGGTPRRDANDSQDDQVIAMVIDDEVNPDPETLDEMERKKERIAHAIMKRKTEQEGARQRKEMEALRRKEEERAKEEEKQRKKEEEKAKRAAILEQHKIKKAREEAEKEGRPFEMPDSAMKKPAAGPKLRAKPGTATTTRPRPKTIHVESGTSPAAVAIDYGTRTMSSKGKRGSNTNLTDHRAESSRGSNPTLSRRGSNSSLHGETQTPSRYRTMERGAHSGRKDLSVPRYAGQSGGSVRSSREDLYGSRGYRGSNSSLNDADSYEPYHTPLVHSGRKGSGFMTGARQDSTLMTATAASASRAAANRANSVMSLRRSGSLMDFSGDGETIVIGARSAQATPGPSSRRISPAVTPTSTPYRRFPSPTGPGSLPPGLVSKRRVFDDGASDISSNQDYIGPKLYKQPAARSNRSIILNAVEYCVFPGMVNELAKRRVLEEITRSENKNFLILFRDSACQFRAIYAYNPEYEEIIKMYGNGPKVVNDSMFEKFFKYNSGGKCFSQVHTKHLTVTIDAFTIHAGLWQGKKTSLPNKKDMTLVI